MNHFIFYRPGRNWLDILRDPAIKPLLLRKVLWGEHLLISLKEDDTITSYIGLKWGDELRTWNQLFPDRTPILGTDYTITKPYKRSQNLDSGVEI